MRLYRMYQQRPAGKLKVMTMQHKFKHRDYDIVVEQDAYWYHTNDFIATFAEPDLDDPYSRGKTIEEALADLTDFLDDRDADWLEKQEKRDAEYEAWIKQQRN